MIKVICWIVERFLTTTWMDIATNLRLTKRSKPNEIFMGQKNELKNLKITLWIINPSHWKNALGEFYILRLFIKGWIIEMRMVDLSLIWGQLMGLFFELT